MAERTKDFPIRDSKDAEKLRKSVELTNQNKGLTPDVYPWNLEYDQRKINPARLESTSPFDHYNKGGMVKKGSFTAPKMCAGGKVVRSWSK